MNKTAAALRSFADTAHRECLRRQKQELQASGAYLTVTNEVNFLPRQDWERSEVEEQRLFFNVHCTGNGAFGRRSTMDEEDDMVEWARAARAVTPVEWAVGWMVEWGG